MIDDVDAITPTGSLQSAIAPEDQLAADHPATRRAAMIAAAVGIIHALLLLSAFLILKVHPPSVGASDDEIISYYSDSSNRRIVLVATIYLIPFSAIAFIWFIVALRMWASRSVRRINILFANVQLVCGIVYITLLLSAGASMSVLAAQVELAGDSNNLTYARQFPQFGVTLFVVLAMRMAAMFVFATTSLLRAERILPRWFVAVGIVVGLALLLSATVSSWFIAVFPIWIVCLCAIIIFRARRSPLDAFLPDEPPTATAST